jgi:hypothetical protein
MSPSLVRWLLLQSIAIVWIGAPFVLAEVLSRNASAGVYGIADAIVLPVITSWIFCFVGLPYFAFFAVSAFRRYSFPLAPWHFRLTVRHVVVLLLSIAGAFLLLSQLVYWWSWQHLPIVLMYGATLAWLVWVRPIAGEQRNRIK